MARYIHVYIHILYIYIYAHTSMGIVGMCVGSNHISTRAYRHRGTRVLIALCFLGYFQVSFWAREHSMGSFTAGLQLQR